MTFGRQTIASVAQLLGALSVDAADVLLYKHLGVFRDNNVPVMRGFLWALEAANDNQVKSLVGELVREKSAVRADAADWDVFNGRWREVERWLLHDGWAIEDGQLVRLTPEAEEATGVRDRLIAELDSSDLDNDEAIHKCIEDSARSFVKEPPDYNDSTTKVRIVLETIARRAAANIAASKSVVYSQDSWGKALECLRIAGVLDRDEEEMMARVYKFISPGAHLPAGITDEEWARLARTFGLSSSYFMFKKYKASR